MKKILGGTDRETPLRTKIICTLKELRFFFTCSLWNKKYRFPRNNIRMEFMDCFDPLTWD
jgi:hypothetical protein